ncbi:MAG: glycosyltransferase family 4 protein [Bacteroidota bacterium]
MNIVIVFNSKFAGGSELALLETVAALHSKGHKLHIVFPESGEMRARVEPYAASVTILYFNWFTALPPLMSGFRKYWFGKGYFLQALKFIKLLKAVKAEKVLTNSISTPSAAMAAKFLGIPHYWYLHEFGPEDHNLKFIFGQKFTVGRMAAMSERVLVNSKAVYNKFKNFMPEAKLKLVYYGVPMQKKEARAFPDKMSSLNIVMVGRTAPGKRQEDAVKALKILRDAGISATLNLVGRREEKYGNVIDNLAKELGVQDSLIITQYTPEPNKIVALADVAVVCSKNEAFGRVTAEAQKTGIPVVATRSAGTPELITEGETGLMYEPENYTQLAEQLQRIYNEPGLAARLGANGYKFAWNTFSEAKHLADAEDALGLK